MSSRPVAPEPLYLDHQATTPVDPRVKAAMLPYLEERFGNAASTSHRFGWLAEDAVVRAREQVAALIGASPSEIVFTSGATEANNLAILGAARAHGLSRPEQVLLAEVRAGRLPAEVLPAKLVGVEGAGPWRDHLVTVGTEHKAVLDPVRALVDEGYRSTVLGVDAQGLVDVDAFDAALGERTVLASVMAANNEIGVLQPLAELGARARAKGVLFHTDAAQAAGKIPLDVRTLPVDLLSLSAHKLYGPKGVGALYVRRKAPRVSLVPLVYGGGHERGLRSGTLDVPGIVGLGAACALAQAELEAEATRLRLLRARLYEGLRARLDRVELNGALEPRLPGNLSLSFHGVAGEALIHALGDIAVSSGSACTSASREPSHVLRALGVGDDRAHSSLRFGLGRSTTAADIDRVIDRVVDRVQKLRAMSPDLEPPAGGLTWEAP